MKTKLQKLESIRGFAAIYVVFHHILPHFKFLGNDLGWLFKFGQEAVILFFLLSGFVIEYSFTFSADKSPKAYFLKRFLRIYIPWFFVLLTQALMNYKHLIVDLDWFNVIGNIFMLQDLPELKPNVKVSPIFDNSPLWSLSYEWWFYMLYFPLKRFFNSKSSRIVGVLGVFSALTYTIYPNFINRELMYLTIWWMGVAIARLYCEEKEISVLNLKFEILAVVLIFLILLVYTIAKGPFYQLGIHPILELRHFGSSVILIFLALLWRKLNWFGFNFVALLFTWIAPISYEVYISHYFLICQANYLSDLIFNPFFKYVIYFVVCLCYAFVIQRLFKYFNNLLISKL